MSATLSEEVMSLKKLILRNPVSSACVGIFNVNEVRISELMWYKVIIIIFLWPTGTNPQAEILKLNNVNGCYYYYYQLLLFFYYLRVLRAHDRE